LDDLGATLAPDLFECEVRYLVTHEWACTAEDILWRRTKLGLHADKPSVIRLQNWLNSNATIQGHDVSTTKDVA
jgi:glycerol-3-phosphate dehydrogenase